MKTRLADKECAPCKGGQPPLAGDIVAELSQELNTAWSVVESKRLERDFKFKDFKTALDFTNRVGELAEQQNHHPDIYLTWGKVRLTIWTHSISGLSEADFVLAAKVDELK
jgi:4a-hydroxytetrahydrobiopterin dehydratase